MTETPLSKKIIEKVVSLKWHKEQYDKAFNLGLEEGKRIKEKEDRIKIKEVMRLQSK
ncbi:hypothetical protein CCP1ISM_60036 [Azospirillaceae bacterium]